MKTSNTLSINRALVFCISVMLAMVFQFNAVHASDLKTQQVNSTVNINQASAKEISKALTGIGKTKADAIVSYREQNGQFTAVEDLLKVKGIGKKTLEQNQDRIRL